MLDDLHDGPVQTMRRILAVFPLILSWPGPAAAVETTASAVSSITLADLRRHAERLADDTLEGREAGSRGGQAAGHYLGREFRRHALAGGVDARNYYQTFGAQYRNILGLLEGSDPRLKSEVVLVGAHYDHVGYGNSQNSYGPTGYIHNGADDNASGVAGLLELVEAFSRLEIRPKRTILFALWDGEEKGLLGSEHWAAHPTVPLDRIRLAINLDMIGRLGRNRLETYGIRTTYGLRRLVSMGNELTDLTFDFSWSMRDDSDHYSFYKRNVPVLMFHTGLHSDYHRPSDDVEKLDLAGMERITRLLFNVVHNVADAPRLYAFRAASRSESSDTQRRREQPLLPLPPRLGVRWKATDDGRLPGVTILSVTPGGAAWRAGLKAGDRIVRFAGQELVHDEDLAHLVLAAESPVSVSVERAGAAQVVDLKVQLAGRPIHLGISWRWDDAEPGVAIVSRVVPNSPAAEAGIQVNDRIYEVAGESFVSEAELRRLIAAASEERLSILSERRGRIRRLSIAPLPTASSSAANPGQ